MTRAIGLAVAVAAAAVVGLIAVGVAVAIILALAVFFVIVALIFDRLRSAEDCRLVARVVFSDMRRRLPGRAGPRHYRDPALWARVSCSQAPGRCLPVSGDHQLRHAGRRRAWGERLGLPSRAPTKRYKANPPRESRLA